MSLIKEERTSLSSEQNESDDSQNINGSLKENQNILEDEQEYNKNEIIEIFNEVEQIEKKEKKVSFKDEKNLVTVIEVESYKNYNSPIEIGPKKSKKSLKKDYIKEKKRKDTEIKKEMEFTENYCYDKEGDSGKSCSIF